LFKLFGHFNILFFLFVTLSLHASFEDFKKSQSRAYTHFSDPRDNGFESYLQSQWEEYQAYITPAMFTKPKPKQITPLVEKEPPKVGPAVLIELPKEFKKPKVLKEKVKKKKKTSYDINLDFYGLELGFSKDEKILSYRFSPRSQVGIGAFFAKLAKSNYAPALQQIQNYKRAFLLNDWAVYLLVKKLSFALYDSVEEARMYQWFILTKLGYDVKIALAADDIYLLHYVATTIYQQPRYQFSGKYYYIISDYDLQKVKKIYTYKGNYPKARKALDFSLTQLPLLPQNRIVKERTFSYEGKNYKITYSQNKNLLNFMGSYPQVDYGIYFNAAMDKQTYNELAKQIKEYCDGKKMADALNFVLRFVQKAFLYKRDDLQFGKEKVMFADETLFFDASDCEDRAVLYAILVKRLFHFSVIGVKYSDHMSTALYIPLQGESVTYRGRRYVLADPTYINANIGHEIKRYQSVQPEQFIYLK